MAIETLTIGDPYFSRILSGESSYRITSKTIVLNLGDDPIQVREQSLGPLQSAILKKTEIDGVFHAVVIEGLAITETMAR